jgi:hypothetical protein
MKLLAVAGDVGRLDLDVFPFTAAEQPNTDKAGE